MQLAAFYSLDVITTCSPGNFDLVKDLGAGFAFDDKSPEIVEQIRAVGQELAHVFDTIGNNSSSETASKVVRTPGCLCTVRPRQSENWKSCHGS